MATEPNMPRQLPTDSDKSREALAEMVHELRATVDRFTIKITGVQYNGRECVVDETGGAIGRIEAAIKAQKKLFWYLFGFLMLDKGVANAQQIGSVLEALKRMLGQ